MKHAVRWDRAPDGGGTRGRPGVGRGAAPDGVHRQTCSRTSAVTLRKRIGGFYAQSGSELPLGARAGACTSTSLASDNLRGVFGFEIDGIWGAIRMGIAGCSTGTPTRSGTSRPSGCTSISACRRCRSAIARAWAPCRCQVTPLHGAIVLYGDSAGGDTLLTVSDQVAVHLYYTQFARGLRPGQRPLPRQRQVWGDFRHRRDAAAEAPRGAGSASAVGLWLYGERPSPA